METEAPAEVKPEVVEETLYEKKLRLQKAKAEAKKESADNTEVLRERATHNAVIRSYASCLVSSRIYELITKGTSKHLHLRIQSRYEVLVHISCDIWLGRNPQNSDVKVIGDEKKSSPTSHLENGDTVTATVSFQPPLLLVRSLYLK
eukprot:872226-Prorocentrum_minimum.AAC.4